MAKCVIRTQSWRARFGLLVAAGGFGIGCSSQSEETKRQLDLMNERILILQNDRDRLVERVDALEQHKSPGVHATPMTLAPGRPALKVVHLTPASSEKSTETAAGAVNGEAPAAESPAVEPAVAIEAPSEHPNVAPAEQSQRVVLYGEGQVSGVRESASQELQ